MVKRSYCTYADHRYLPRALTLIESIRERGCDDPIWLCCLTEEGKGGIDFLKDNGIEFLNSVNFLCLSLIDLEAAYPELLIAKTNRTTLEYYFTCTPALIEHIFNISSAETVTYLDADLFFFGSPDDVHEEIGDAPVAIIPHHNTQNWRNRYGLYNVGWVTFSRSSEGLECLTWWRLRCVEWCYARVEEGKYADQGYLNMFHKIASNTKIIMHRGCNLAPWNLGNYCIRTEINRVFVDNSALIFFHFHGLRRLSNVIFTSDSKYRVPYSRTVRNCIYLPYLRRLILNESKLRFLLFANTRPLRRRSKGYLSTHLLKSIFSCMLLLFDFTRANVFFVSKNQVY
jgi:hypothetical protein